MKITEINGYKYSREEFEGHKFRAMFRFRFYDDWRNDKIINIYTDNPNREEVSKTITLKTTDKVMKCILEHWTTKEQDELTSKFIEEILKDF